MTISAFCPRSTIKNILFINIMYLLHLFTAYLCSETIIFRYKILLFTCDDFTFYIGSVKIARYLNFPLFTFVRGCHLGVTK